MNKAEGNPIDHIIYKFEEVVNRPTIPVTEKQKKQDSCTTEISPFIELLSDLSSRCNAIEGTLNLLKDKLSFYIIPEKEEPFDIPSTEKSSCECLNQIKALDHRLARIEHSLSNLLKSLCL